MNDLTALTGAPLASGSTLTGFDSSQFHARQYAYLDQSEHVQELSLAASGSWHVNDLTVLAGGAPLASGSALTGFDASQFHSVQNVYVDSNAHVQELAGSPGGSWQVTDLTSITSSH